MVALPVDKKFHYGIPEAIEDELAIGKRVKVPFGNRLTVGYCVGFVDRAEVDGIKDIKAVIDKHPFIDSEMLELTRRISRYYYCSWGEALDAVVPRGVKKAIQGKTVKIVRLAKADEDIRDEIKRIEARSPSQAMILKTLLNVNNEIRAQELLKITNSNYGSLFQLARRKLISYSSTPSILLSHQLPAQSQGPVCVQRLTASIAQAGTGRQVYDEPIDKGPKPTLTEEQQRAVQIVKERLWMRRFDVILLQGVTGSGKTEVYLRGIEEAINLGLSSIVLVPEISLTPQTIKRFKARFSEVAVLHSNLTESCRKEQWQKIKYGMANVIIGTRSAVFAPLKNLGLIIIDEEHENTFKQDNTPRYHARDVAIMRATHNNALMILGSATPSLESYYKALTGGYSHIIMNKRIEKMSLPSVEIVDMQKELRETKRYRLISRQLENGMRQAIMKNEQIILFLNRRGFAPYISCTRCGFVLKCKRCDIILTYHKKTDTLVCHYCNGGELPVKDCPDCAMSGIKYRGFGTERIEEEIKTRFPSQRIIRMDSDTMKGSNSYQTAFDSFCNGKADILLGTQMIAKGFDFPNVTLVGVISADIALNIPDFRASERTFQLLTQVSGRTGRGDKGGRVIIQSFNPTHYSIQFALSSDYDGFARNELRFRKQLNYPPYGHLLRIIFQGKCEEMVKDRAIEVTNRLKRCAEISENHVEVLGPASSPISKIKDKFRWHAILKAPGNRCFQEIRAAVAKDLTPSKAVQIIVDVDPISVL